MMEWTVPFVICFVAFCMGLLVFLVGTRAWIVAAWKHNLDRQFKAINVMLWGFIPMAVCLAGMQIALYCAKGQ